MSYQIRAAENLGSFGNDVEIFSVVAALAGRMNAGTASSAAVLVRSLRRAIDIEVMQSSFGARTQYREGRNFSRKSLGETTRKAAYGTRLHRRRDKNTVIFQEKSPKAFCG